MATAHALAAARADQHRSRCAVNSIIKPIADRLPSKLKRQGLRRVLETFGFSRAWVLDDGDGAEFYFFVPREEWSSQLDSEICGALSAEIPRRKASVLPFPARDGVPMELFLPDPEAEPADRERVIRLLAAMRRNLRLLQRG